ncbi:hypothetical protein GCM10027449_28220 [Sinomonas notoginsengisoli]|uniref:hypothetical protein n=1 Tax=Sinomonas notoginsengisoli TaxID=1457311 RepID=UPI001F3D190F|nr:hypothetical protein [Sinomonas notoginsengisoli]
MVSDSRTGRRRGFSGAARVTRRAPIRILAAGGAALLALILAGCGAGSGAPVWTGVASGTSSATAAPGGPTPGGPAASGSAASSAATARGSGTPSPGATSTEWKTYTDPAKKVRFELPAAWIVQSTDPAPGAAPGSLRLEVKKRDGTFVAALATGLPVPSTAACDPAQAKVYSVLNSVPAKVPFADGPNVITPRFVFRVIQGYKFFGSFGLTALATAAQDGKACQLSNLVPGPAGIGGYSFADTTEVAPPSTETKVAPLKSFDSLAQASAYVRDSGDFADAQRMIMSLAFT